MSNMDKWRRRSLKDITRIVNELNKIADETEEKYSDNKEMSLWDELNSTVDNTWCK